ncbi:MAG: DUF5367 family protein [Reichenbachiella sp.]|uniref:DUF5367 family protein n=1 Tax=Reichenbachiella sp. TaxID=2184521 RepID=UPI00329832F0
MKTIKAIIIAVLIWMVGVSFFTLSYYLPVLEDLELQANLTLAVILIPTVWIGTHVYYKWSGPMHGLKAGVIIVVTLIMMDALFTVPYFIMPYGGSYQEFFGAASFWLIAMECQLVIYLYWSSKIKNKQS